MGSSLRLAVGGLQGQLGQAQDDEQRQRGERGGDQEDGLDAVDDVGAQRMRASPWAPACAANTAPRTAAPTAPPSARKKPVVAVATPSSRRSTLFWTATTRTWVTMPKPRPNTASAMPVATCEGSPAKAASRTSATVISARPAIGKRL